MLNLFKLKKSGISKKVFIENFINDPNHVWIKENIKIKRIIEYFLEDFTEEELSFFNIHKTYLIPCEASLSCAIGSTKDHHLILVFPELKNLILSASPTHALAILYHEFGHIYYQHTENKVETLKAQIEADDFAFKHGYGEELQEILLDHINSIDCRVRISKLTAKLISNKY